MLKKSILLAATLLTGLASRPASAAVYGVFSNGSTADSAALVPAATPEPASLAVSGVGLLGLRLARRRAA